MEVLNVCVLPYFSFFRFFSKEKDKGIFVIERYKKSDEESVEELFETMKYFAMLDHKGRVKNKIAAKELVNKCDWKDFILFYIEAHNKAIEKWGYVDD